MKLNKLVIQNFLSVQDATLYLADKGLVSIEGQNLDKTGSDSNGSGKSSIINAILWCLYGVYGKDEAADDVVNSKAGKNCAVHTTWQDGDKRYVIARFRKHSKYKNSIEVWHEVDGKFVEITKAGSREVQDQINQIMGADEQVFRASCFAQQENPLDIPAMKDRELKALLEEMLPLEDVGDYYAKATENVAEQKKLVKKLGDEIQMKIWQIDKNTGDLAAAKADFEGYVSSIEEHNKNVDVKVAEKQKALGVALIMADTKDYRLQIKELRGRQSLIGDTNVGKVAAELKFAWRDEEKYKAELASPKNTCDSCGQEVEDLAIVKERLKGKLGDAKAKVAKLQDRLKIANDNLNQHADLEVEIRGLEAKLVECNRAKDTMDRLRSEITLLEGQKTPVGSNPHAEAVERYTGFLEAAITGKADFEAKLEKEQAHLKVLEGVQLTYSPKGLRYHMLERVAPELTATTNKYLQILTDGAVQSVWSTVTRLGSGEYREKFSIEARMEGRTKFGLLSGGEKRKVRLACTYALQDLIARQATKNIEIWCGDEIDEALDASGLERLMVLLAEKTKNKSTILVISHNEMREWIPNHATVTRKDGISTITGYLNGD